MFSTMADEKAPRRERSQNFTFDEDRVLREQYTKNQEYLTSPHNNTVTNKGKNDIWKNIAESVSSLGYAVRSDSACRTRWKNLTSTAKQVFNEYKYAQNGTGGGPAPRPPTASVTKTIELLKDTTAFKGVDGGLSTFSVPTPPSSLPSSLNSSLLYSASEKTESGKARTKKKKRFCSSGERHRQRRCG